MYDDNFDLDNLEATDDLDSLDQNDQELSLTDDPLAGLPTDGDMVPEDMAQPELWSEENRAETFDPAGETAPIDFDNKELDDLSTLDDLNVEHLNLNEDQYWEGDLVEEEFAAADDIDYTEPEASSEWLDVPLESALHHDLGFAPVESQISFGGYYNNDGTYHWSSTGENTDSKGNVVYYS